MAGHLEQLLRLIRDEQATAEQVAVARDLVRSDARLPEELREIVLVEEAELPSDAAGLLSVLGCDDLGALLAEAVLAESRERAPPAADVPLDSEEDEDWQVIAEILREGLHAEAGVIEVAETVLRRLAVAGWAWGPILAQAVRAEAGSVDVVDAVIGTLSLEDAALQTPLPVADAVRAEAGSVDVVDAVIGALSLEDAALQTSVPVADAVRAEAGSVDVVNAVIGALSLEGALVSERSVPVAAAVRAEAGSIDVANAVLEAVGVSRPSSLAQPRALPRAANNRRYWSAVIAIAAAVLVVVGVRSAPEGSAPDTGVMLFAHAGEIVVEDLSYGDDVQVLQTEGDEGAVILWVDEEA